MLSSRIEVTDREVNPLDFVLTYDGMVLSRFYFPIMDMEKLEKLATGQDVEDQNDDGFIIKQKALSVFIEIQSNADCSEVFYTKFRLGHGACLPAFKQLIPHYIAAEVAKQEAREETEKESPILDEETLEYLDEIGQGDETGKAHLKLIKDRKMDKKQATWVFSNFMNCYPNKLNVPLVKNFIKLGLDINDYCAGYWTDERRSNALMMAVEYRRLNDMEVLIACGATVWYSDFIYDLLEGHSASDVDISTQEQLDDLIYALDLLITHEACVTREHLGLVKQRYFKTDYLTELLDFIESKIGLGM